MAVQPRRTPVTPARRQTAAAAPAPATRRGRHGLLLGGALAAALLSALGAGALAMHGQASASPAPEGQNARALSQPAITATPADLIATPTAISPPSTREAVPTLAAPAPAATTSTGLAFAATAAVPTVAVTPLPTPEGTPAVSPTPVATPPAASPTTAATASVPATPSPTPALAFGATTATPVAVALSSAAVPLEREHQVQPGEVLSAIAQRYGLTTETVLANNPIVTDRDALKIGLRLRIPPRDGVLYEVRLGDSLQSVARRYGVEASAILSEPVNKLSSPDLLREGQVVLVPGATRAVTAPAPIAVTAAPASTPTAVATTVATSASSAAAPSRTATRVPTAQPTPAARPVQAAGWLWPITGMLTSYFGPDHPLGIDIALNTGAPIMAARAGTVTFAGGNPCCSYGYYVEIDHGDGFRTVYGHLSAPPPVRIGQSVARGEVIGSGGNTGYSTGPHLHFEIRRAGIPTNPLEYLP